tara:strand:- start:311 stop:571 length:261 start_codon:yes stop_codon:yes gene_type:complete
METKQDQKEYGVQPLNEIMEQHKIESKILLATSEVQITFKNIKKAREGRRISKKIQLKILKALNTLLHEKIEKPFDLNQLFNYKSG